MSVFFRFSRTSIFLFSLVSALGAGCGVSVALSPSFRDAVAALLGLVIIVLILSTPFLLLYGLFQIGRLVWRSRRSVPMSIDSLFELNAKIRTLEQQLLEANEAREVFTRMDKDNPLKKYLGLVESVCVHLEEGLEAARAEAVRHSPGAPYRAGV